MYDQNSSRRDFMKTSAAAPTAASAQTTSAAQSPAGVEADSVRASEWPASRSLKKKVLWNELSLSEFPPLLENDPVVILPIGSLEQHGPHCPVDMDISIPYHIAVTTAEDIDDFPVVIGPPVWTGFTHYNMGGYGTITVHLETFIDVVSDVCRSIKANGFDRIILMNGHGGNVAPVTSIANKLAHENIITLSFPYWNLVQQEMRDWSTADMRGPGHAGEWETAFQMYLSPHLVLLDRREAGKRGGPTVRRSGGMPMFPSAAVKAPTDRWAIPLPHAGERRAHLQAGGGTANGDGPRVSHNTGFPIRGVRQRREGAPDAFLTASSLPFEDLPKAGEVVCP